MKHVYFTRRSILCSLFVLPGCAALSSLDQAARPLAVYDLTPVSVTAPSGRSGLNLLVLEPSAPAAISTNRILIRPAPMAVTYLPDAQWADEVPLMVQSLLIRSLSGTGQIGFVGAPGSGPVPDLVLLGRIDRFEVVRQSDSLFTVGVVLDLSLMRDRDQRIIARRTFQGVVRITQDQSPLIVQSFQNILDDLLAQVTSWTNAQV